MRMVGKMSNEKPKWDQPSNIKSAVPSQAGELAREHGISTERAQMLIDRLGHDPAQLNAAAKDLRINPKT